MPVAAIYGAGIAGRRLYTETTVVYGRGTITAVPVHALRRKVIRPGGSSG